MSNARATARGGSRRLIRFLQLSLVVGLLFVVLLLVGVFALHQAGPTQFASYGEVREQATPSYIEILDRQGQRLDSIRQDYTKRQGEWVSLDAVSPSFIQAILLSEDKRFYEHHGVDWWALANAIQAHLKHKIAALLKLDSTGQGGRGGASGITMQLVSLLQPSLQGQGKRNYRQKWRQLAAALALEKAWSKEEILEAYINLLPFRGEIVGIGAAAETFYGKYAFALNPRESAILAAMARAPNASIKRLTERSCDVLQKMAYGEQCTNLQHFVGHYLSLPHPQVLDREQQASHISVYARQWANRQGGLSVRTTLDADIQRYGQTLIQQHLRELQGERVHDAALVVLDNSTGAILSYIGSSGALSRAAEVDHVRAHRQSASTLKPFLYAQALDERRYTAASLLNDAPIKLLAGEGLYVPQNHDRQFVGLVSVRTALASSLNIPAVRTMLTVGLDSFYQKLKDLNLPLERSSEHYGYSLALGAVDLDLLSLTNAYRTLANQGRYGEVYWLADEKVQRAEREIFSAEASWIIADILSDRQARAATFGLDSVLTTPFWTAVKTGTSKDMRDNWTLGWSAHYTVGVWVGNSDGRSMQNVLGVSGAGPIWHDMMRYLHRQLPSQAPQQPLQLVAQAVEFVGLDEAPRVEYFLPGTELQQVIALSSQAQQDARPIKIQSPVDGTILALDPDIPEAVQQLVLKAQVTPQDSRVVALRWYIDGVEIGRGAQSEWSLQRGRYRISLKAQDEELLDEVTVFVR